jgi:hypothetical protein
MSNVKMTGLIRDTTCGQGHPFPHPIPGAVNLRSPLASLTAARLINLHHFLSLTTKNNSATRKKKQSIISRPQQPSFACPRHHNWRHHTLHEWPTSPRASLRVLLLPCPQFPQVELGDHTTISIFGHIQNFQLTSSSLPSRIYPSARPT